MSTVYTNIKNKKLTVETSNTTSPYGTDNKKSGGEVVAKFESKQRHIIVCFSVLSISSALTI
jgi:hypothetical protein